MRQCVQVGFIPAMQACFSRHNPTPYTAFLEQRRNTHTVMSTDSVNMLDKIQPHFCDAHTHTHKHKTSTITNKDKNLYLRNPCIANVTVSAERSKAFLL